MKITVAAARTSGRRPSTADSAPARGLMGLSAADVSLEHLAVVSQRLDRRCTPTSRRRPSALPFPGTTPSRRWTSTLSRSCASRPRSSDVTPSSSAFDEREHGPPQDVEELRIVVPHELRERLLRDLVRAGCRSRRAVAMRVADRAELRDVRRIRRASAGASAPAMSSNLSGDSRTTLFSSSLCAPK